MMTFMPIVAIAGLVGALIGSFLNVCIYRLPRQESVVWPASHCTVCGLQIAYYDNIPLFSYGILRGRCRGCGSSISIQYPMVELVTAIGYGLIVMYFGVTGTAFVYTLLFSALIVITGTDLSHQVIPDAITLPGLIVGVLSAAVILPLGILNSLAGVAVGGGLLWGLAWVSPYLFGKEGMGGGDIKLMAMVGAFLGWKPVLLAIMLGSLIGSIVGVTLIALRVMNRNEYLPFGPFLAVGSLVALFLHQPIVDWYWSLFEGVP